MSESHEHGLPPKSSISRWFLTTNHKDIGVLYLVTALFFFVFGGTLALLFRLELITPAADLLGPMGYNQAVSTHGLLMVFWFISPFAFGFANYLVPLQIGADDLAFPRLNALSYWLYLFSGVLMGVSFFQGMTFAGGWTMYAPLNTPAYIPGEGLGATSVVLALIMFTAAVTLGSVNFLTTMYRMRAENLRMRDIPIFSLSINLTVWMMLFAFAALLAALMILASDHIIGTNYFQYSIDGTTMATDADNPGASLLWAHLFWFFGHPEVYIVFFPALGVMAECFQTFTGRRLVGRKWFIISMVLVALQSFAVWMHHMFLTGINLPIKTVFMATTIGISLPFDLMVFSLIYTMAKGRVRFKTPFLFSLGALILFIIGGITGVFLGAIVLDYQFRGTYWVVAHFHYVMVAGATALFGGLYYWYPKITGKMYDETLGKLHFAVYFVGFNLLYFPMFIAWETPRRVFQYSQDLQIWHSMATAGGFLLGASFLIMFYNLFASLWRGEDAGDSPWAYATSAEWAVSSPPPLENFPGVPSYAGGSLSFLDDEEVAERTRKSGSGVAADVGTATDGGTAADGGEPSTGRRASSGYQPGGGTASVTPVTATGTPSATTHATGGEEHASHASLWPFLISLGGFLALLGLSGVRTGSVVYVTLAAVGGLATFGALFGMAREPFHAPEMPIAERWPFADVEKTKLGMWTFLASDIVLFGAFIGSYAFVRVAYGWTAWHHDLIPAEHVTMPGLVNTYLLLTSSFLVVLAMVAAERESKRGTTAALAGTFALGVGFLINKGLEWQHLFHIHTELFPNGWNLSTNIASSTFYLTTGLHGAHVVIGLLICGYMTVRAWNGAYQGDDRAIEYFGLYWHFVDIVWLFLFPLFYIL
ncbi:cbb3-type cytochrome c oxidase subunit I [Haloarcula nitratireducens]|uniref:Cbb3-type cytochrome c oxidase subunit I n=1 Tax=Haloarcula nitratireducens TaxID=2487749 RepID=A0AAW4PCG6_9EURY|nr:cbb3-type cytochrome c oxidase subunit I [Halomicroarcula nitratireducens]MBX0295413.1 cbb3-type cytochrome c oxidase subunit I [Halomicroarcula nitratireducens]